MPWTFAHPAAVLPLARLCPQWLSLPALIVGSLAPDFGYYIGAFSFATLAHSAQGIVFLCLPTALAVLALLSFLRHPLFAPIPAPHRQILLSAFEAPASALPRRIAVAVVSVLVGAATHVVWDAFTHATGFGVQFFPELHAFVALVGGRNIRVFNVLQHLSTLFGVACLALAYRGALERSSAYGTSEALEGNAARWCILTSVAVAALVTGGLLAVAGEPAPPYVLVVRSIIYATSSFLVLYVLASFYWWHRSRIA